MSQPTLISGPDPTIFFKAKKKHNREVLLKKMWVKKLKIETME